MKRSQINDAIRRAEARLEDYRISLPMFGYWTLSEWKKRKHMLGDIADAMLGWDVTDFGSGNFEETGAVLFTVRNGDKNDRQMCRPYCEKYIILDDTTEQQIPLHYHISKTEDIINRGGGTLVIQLYHRTADGGLDTQRPISVYMDGIYRTVQPGERVEVAPGNSITLEPYVYHRFIAKKGDGLLIVGEVSKVNDDCNDNVFFNPSERFSEIEEDEEPLHPLVNEYTAL